MGFWAASLVPAWGGILVPEYDWVYMVGGQPVGILGTEDISVVIVGGQQQVVPIAPPFLLTSIVVSFTLLAAVLILHGTKAKKPGG